jgi:hypothetical protein
LNRFNKSIIGSSYWVVKSENVTGYGLRFEGFGEWWQRLRGRGSENFWSLFGGLWVLLEGNWYIFWELMVFLDGNWDFCRDFWFFWVTFGYFGGIFGFLWGLLVYLVENLVFSGGTWFFGRAFVLSEENLFFGGTYRSVGGNLVFCGLGISRRGL